MAMGRRAAGSRSTKQAAVAAAPRRKHKRLFLVPWLYISIEEE
jgi:hypothetical protein